MDGLWATLGILCVCVVVFLVVSWSQGVSPVGIWSMMRPWLSRTTGDHTILIQDVANYPFMKWEKVMIFDSPRLMKAYPSRVGWFFMWIYPEDDFSISISFDQKNVIKTQPMSNLDRAVREAYRLVADYHNKIVTGEIEIDEDAENFVQRANKVRMGKGD